MRRLATTLATLSLVAIVLLAGVAYSSGSKVPRVGTPLVAQTVTTEQVQGGGETIGDDEVPMASGAEQIEDEEVPMAAPGQQQESGHGSSIMMVIGAITLAVAAFFMVHIHKLNSNISAMRGKLD